MLSRKYLRHWRLTTRVDRRGRVRSEAEYIGEYYVFRSPPARRQRLRLLALCALGWLSFLAALLPRSLAAHLTWVVLPFAFCALPLGLATASALALARVQSPLRQDQADRFSRRFPAAAFALALLGGVSFVSFAVSALALSGRLLAGDAVFAAGCLVTALCGLRLGLFAHRHLRADPLPAD